MYRALYRKWRPQRFEDVVGQRAIVTALKNQITAGRVGHAYLFTGVRGTGKTTCAKIFAKAVNCLHPEGGDPCGKCEICKGIDNGSLLDVVEMDAASNNGVDDIRDLRDETAYTPSACQYKVYIIDEVHMLSNSAFNALLKILEEPPEHLTFILATTELNKVPATILSRCQRHSFKRLDSEVITAHLEHVASCEGLNLEHDAAELIAGLAEGGMRDALSLFDQCSGAADITVDSVYSAMGLAGNRRTAKLLDYTVKRNTEAALELFDELWTDGKDPATLLGELNTLLRDCMMLSVAPRAGANLLSGRFDKEILAVFCKKLTKAELLCRINTVSDYLIKIRGARSPRLCVEMCLVALCDPSLTEGLDELRARVSRLEYDMSNAPMARYTGDDEDYAPAGEIPYDELPARPSVEYDDDELDASQFAEYQPEDDLLDKGVSPVDLNPDAAPEAKDAPVDNALLWAEIIDKAESSLPVGLIPILSDPTQARCEVSYDTMHLYVVPGFFYDTIDKQDVLIRLRDAANDVTGRSLKIQLSELVAGDSKPTRTVDELKKFKEVRFI